MKKNIFLIALAFTFYTSYAQDNEYDKNKNFTIVSYNVENLFDTFDDAVKKDDEFTPNGKKKWTEKRFNEKINHIAKVLCSINKNELPEIIGLYEIENDYVLKALLKQDCLAKGNYKIVHEESPDFRGIDVALLFREDAFKYLSHKKIKLNGFVKSFVCKARKLGKGEAYFLYVEPCPGEAQRRRRTFYKAVMKFQQ